MEREKVEIILDYVTKRLSLKWKKIAFYYAFNKTAWSCDFFVDTGNGYNDCYHIGVDNTVLREISFTINNQYLGGEKELLPLDMWGILTFEATSKGNLDFNYQIENLNETFPDHVEQWSNQYYRKKDKKVEKEEKKRHKNMAKIAKANQSMIQHLANILQEYLPTGWQEVVFFAGYYQDDSGFLKYFVKLDNGKYIDCFNLIPEDKILQPQLFRLHREIKSVRVKLPQKHKWVCMVFSFTNQGKFDQEYDYADGVAQSDLQNYVENYKNKLNTKYLLQDK